MDKQTFTSVYETQYSRVYNYISYRIDNHMDTEDLVSQVFTKVIENYDSYDPKRAALSTWIVRIAHNTVVDYYRSRQKNRSASLEDVEGVLTSGETPDMLILRDERSRMLMTALAALTPRERNMVALKYGAQLGNKEIARVLSLSESNVGVSLFRIIRKLRSYMEKEESVCGESTLNAGKMH